MKIKGTFKQMSQTKHATDGTRAKKKKEKEEKKGEVPQTQVH